MTEPHSKRVANMRGDRPKINRDGGHVDIVSELDIVRECVEDPQKPGKIV
jgi:hypothetical protein